MNPTGIWCISIGIIFISAFFDNNSHIGRLLSKGIFAVGVGLLGFWWGRYG